MNRTQTGPSPVSRRDGGFTLLETVVAIMILTIGVLGLAQVFYLGMQHMSTSAAEPHRPREGPRGG